MPAAPALAYDPSMRWHVGESGRSVPDFPPPVQSVIVGRDGHPLPNTPLLVPHLATTWTPNTDQRQIAFRSTAPSLDTLSTVPKGDEVFTGICCKLYRIGLIEPERPTQRREEQRLWC
jgi:hypothetical protein